MFMRRSPAVIFLLFLLIFPVVFTHAQAAKQGRAEDVLIAATFKFSDHFVIKAGYRILEGGADSDEVYNFALFHYGSLGLFFTL